MIRSLRTRLLLGTLSATLCIFVAAAGILYWSIQRAMLTEFDATLTAESNTFTALTEQGRDGLKTDIDPAQMPEYRREKHPDFFAISTRDGIVVAQSQSLAGYQAASLGTALFTTPEFAFITLPNGRPGRKVAQAFMPRFENEGEPERLMPQTAVVVVARDTGELHEKKERLAWLLILVFSSAALASAAMLWWIVGRGLHPLRKLADEIQTLGSHSLSERVGTQQVPQELDPVVNRLNALLVELESAFNRERGFTADVAHELRTPLAGMLMTLQVCATRPRTPEEYAAALVTCLGLAGDMRAMTEKLLLMARIESGQQPLASTPVDLRQLAESLWQGYAPKAQARHLRMQWDFPVSLQIQTDGELLAVVLRNLLDNALAYAPEGGVLQMAGNMAHGQVNLRIANGGSQVPTEDAEKVFDRFWRADQAREIHDQHCGLGLALCRRIMTLLSGTIHVKSVLGGDFAVEVIIPDAAMPSVGYDPVLK